MRHPKRRIRDLWKVGRVAAYLARQPRDLVPYFRFGAFTALTPLDLGRPWWAFGAVRALESIIQSEWVAFEFGTGGSTIFLAERVRHLTCVEDDAEWTSLVRDRARGRKLTNVDILFRPFDFWHTADFEQSEYLNSLSGTYDLIVVDGKEWSDQVRDVCFWRAEQHIRVGGVIIVDDSWRYPQIKQKNDALRWKEYRGTGYCRAGVTSTMVFEY